MPHPSKGCVRSGLGSQIRKQGRSSLAQVGHWGLGPGAWRWELGVAERETTSREVGVGYWLWGRTGDMFLIPLVPRPCRC